MPTTGHSSQRDQSRQTTNPAFIPGADEPSGKDAAVPRWATFAWRVVTLHMLTYTMMGLVAFLALDYEDAYKTTDLRFLMLPTDSPWIAAGPALNVIRGLLFAVVLYPLAPWFLTRKGGAILLWSLFLGLAILGTAGPSPGSIEGMIYTKLPMKMHLFGLPEVVIQTLLFSAGLVAWCRKPATWKNVLAGVGVALVLLMSLGGILAALGKLPQG